MLTKSFRHISYRFLKSSPDAPKFSETSVRHHPSASNPEGLAELLVFLIASLNRFYHATGHKS